ncbi:MAG TPA: CDP-alcohol phosphatidyltransferase family protein [Chthoniobacteraceae bacterium]|jgi:phosphatidylcholine synthase
MKEVAADNEATFARRGSAYLVHVYTASGVVFAFLAAAEICQTTPDVKRVFLLLFIALFIDASDGPLARRYQVKRWAAATDGRTIDDIVDYLTFTFIPLLLIWRMGWLPDPAALWIAPALIASLFGFSNTKAKDEVNGFFLGFPSYWNIFAFYAGLWKTPTGTWINGILLLVLALMTLLPVRFIYPNLAPPKWKWPVMVGAFLWLGSLIAVWISYPDASSWLIGASLIYPAFYTWLSYWLHRGRTG